MDADYEMIQFQLFLRGCLEELINCHGTPEWIMDECEWAQYAFPSLERDAYLCGRAWVEGAALAKEKKRSREARKKVAAVLAHALSAKPSQAAKRLSPQERETAFNRLRDGWIHVQELVGLDLSQIEACRLILKKACNCRKSCRKVNFTRDWHDVERRCQCRLSELKGNPRERA